MKNTQKELISFFALTYNQEKYIEDSLKGLFSQTYSPLEIIISDDCSTDKTFEIIQKFVSEYKGPNKVIINRNEKNLGLIKHFNKIISMCNGELIVATAGDDISLPNRVQVIYDRWNKERDSVMAIVSSSYTIDSEGKEINPPMYENKEDRYETDYYNNKPFHGACVAYSKKVFDTFGPLEKYNCYEDMVCYRRSLLLGKVLFLKDKLVKYRLGGISTAKKKEADSYTEFKEIRLKNLEKDKEYIEQLIIDADKVENTDEIKKSLEFILNSQELRISFYKSQRFLKRLGCFFKLFPYLIKKPKKILKQFKFGSHHWKVMFLDLILPESLNNFLFKYDFLAKKLYRK